MDENLKFLFGCPLYKKNENKKPKKAYLEAISLDNNYIEVLKKLDHPCKNMNEYENVEVYLKSLNNNDEFL